MSSCVFLSPSSRLGYVGNVGMEGSGLWNHLHQQALSGASTQAASIAWSNGL